MTLPPRKRPRHLKNPQGLAYINFHGLIAAPAYRYLLETSERLGLSPPRTLGVLLLEHQMLWEKSSTT